jgi:predicted small metal-binding protein
MPQKMKKIECDPSCGFMIKGRDEKELVEIVKIHAKKAHNMTVTDKEIKDKIKDAESL